MDLRAAHKRILAAKSLLLEPSISREQFTAVRSLIEGINPRLDDALMEIDRQIATVEKAIQGRVIELSAEHLPENTEEEKKRKRALLLFINTWNKFKSEVARVEQELQNAEHTQTPGSQVSVWGRIFNVIKNPFSLVTIVAIGAAVALHTTSVQIEIKNDGCGTMQPSSSIPFPLPGFRLPQDPIASGDTALAILPPLTVDVDGTARSAVILKTLNFSLTFGLPSNIKDVTLNSESLLGKKSQVRLSESKEHVLVLVCR